MSESPVWEVSDGDVDEAEVPMVAEEVEEVERKVQRPTCYCMSASSAMRLLAVLGLVVIVGSVIVASMLPNSPVLGWLVAFLDLLSALKLWQSVPAMLVAYVVLVPLGCPITPLNVTCGFLFKFGVGWIVAMSGSTIGALVCFVLGNTLLYGWAKKKMEEIVRLQALYLAIQGQAVKLIVLTHLSPILPSTLLHYTYAAMGWGSRSRGHGNTRLTRRRVQLWKFVLGTVCGIAPFLTAYVYVGSVSRSLSAALTGEGDDSLASEVLILAVSIAMSVVLLLVVTFIAKRELDKAMRQLLEEQKQRDVEEELLEIEVEMDVSAAESQLVMDTEEVIESDGVGPRDDVEESTTTVEYGC